MKSVNKAMKQLIEDLEKDTSEKKSISIRVGLEEYALLTVLASHTKKKPSTLAKIIFYAALEDAKESYLDSCKNEGEEMAFESAIWAGVMQLSPIKNGGAGKPLPVLNKIN